MRIAYLCKRQYMSHDVIADRYARLYEQPHQLARRGHDVLGLCLSYRPTDERDEAHDAAPGTLRWIGLAPGGGLRLGLLAYPARALAVLREFKPDVLVAASDAPHIILGRWLATKLGVAFAVDLYDHFETFGLTRLPGVASRYRAALAHADLVSCVSAPLAGLVRSYGGPGQVLTLPSTINHDAFHPRDRAACRAALGLPPDARLVGTAGGLTAEKGIAVVYEAFEALARQDDSVHLVLAGPTDPQLPPPVGERVHYLGLLPHARVADLICSLDVGIVYVRDTPYGRYSFPQKAYEMAACRVPLAVARIGAMESVFAATPSVFYAPDDGASLAQCLQRQLAAPVVADISVPDWAGLAAEQEAGLARLVRGGR